MKKIYVENSAILSQGIFDKFLGMLMHGVWALPYALGACPPVHPRIYAHVILCCQ